MIVNPARGCGQKKEDAFYAECESAPGGNLQRWIHILDDGGTEHELPLWYAPPRKSIMFNPQASLVANEIVRDGDEFSFLDEDVDLFVSLKGRIPSRGLVDHVGGKFYSAYSFYQETMAHGPSRRMSRDSAVTLARYIHKYGPCPIFFTHSRIPVIGPEQRGEVERVCVACLDSLEIKEDRWQRTWENQDLSLFRGGSGYNGNRSIMLAVLSIVSQLEKNWKNRRNNPAYQAAKELFDSVQFAERPFGATWITRISYTVPSDDVIDTAALSVPNIALIDLGADGGDGKIVGYSTPKEMEVNE